MGGNHLLNTDSVLDCRLHGRLDNQQALPVDCTVAEHLIRRDRYLHSALWNETGDTSIVEDSLDTEEHPYCYSSSRDYFPSCKSRASRVSDWTAFDNDDAWTKRSYRQPPCHLSLWGEKTNLQRASRYLSDVSGRLKRQQQCCRFPIQIGRAHV